MPGVKARVKEGKPQTGVLQEGWQAMVDDYAIAGGWLASGDALVVGDAAGGVHAFSGTSGAVLWAYRNAHQGGVMALSVEPRGGRVATAGQDGRVLIWNGEDGQVYRALDVSQAWVEHLAWSPDSRWLAASSRRAVQVWTAAGDEVWSSPAHPSTVSAVAWATPTELTSACYGRVTLFELPEGRETQRLEWKGSLVSLVLSPNGDIVACGSQDNSVHFWRRTTAQDSMMSGYPSKPSALAFDHTGILLATSGGEAVTMWSFKRSGPEGTLPGVLERHVAPVSALAFTHRGRRLASGGRDSAVVVWDARQDGRGRAVGTAVTSGSVERVCWRPDDRALAALDAEGGVTVWRVG